MRSIDDLTAAEIERLAFERGLTRGLEKGQEEGLEKGLEKGREEGLAEGRRALLALASRVLPPEVVAELESIEGISALEAEIERRLPPPG